MSRKNAPECVPAEGGTAHRLGQVEAYLIVREVLSEASTAVPPKAGLLRERSGFSRCRYATLGLSLRKKSERVTCIAFVITVAVGRA